MRTKLESFLLLNPTTGCMEFQGALNSSGYGNIRIGDRVIGAHRVAYTVYNGEILDGMHVLHKCNNPKCCNPDHLFLGTHKDNMKHKAESNTVNAKGSMNGNAALNEAKVRRIKELCKTTSDLAVALLYKVHVKTIGKIRRGVLWPHVKGE